MNTKHTMTAEEAKHMWNNHLDNPDVHTEVEDGETVMAVRRPTTIDSEPARRAKSGQIQQVVRGDGANSDNKLKRKWIERDLCGGEFADVGCCILRQGASSSGYLVRAEKCTSLECLLSRSMQLCQEVVFCFFLVLQYLTCVHDYSHFFCSHTRFFRNHLHWMDTQKDTLRCN